MLIKFKTYFKQSYKHIKLNKKLINIKSYEVMNKKDEIIINNIIKEGKLWLNLN